MDAVMADGRAVQAAVAIAVVIEGESTVGHDVECSSDVRQTGLLMGRIVSGNGRLLWNEMFGTTPSTTWRYW